MALPTLSVYDFQKIIRYAFNEETGCLRTEGTSTAATLGTALMAASTPVTIATNDTVMTGLSGKWPTAAVIADAETAAGATATVTRTGSRIQAYNGTTFDMVRSGVKTAVTTPTGHMNALTEGVYNATPPTLTDGQVVVKQLDVNGNQKTNEQYAPQAEDNTNGVFAMIRKPIAANTYAPTLATNLGAATKANIKATAGNVLSIVASNANAAGRWINLHNKATIPLATEVPIYQFWVPALSCLIVPDSFFTGSGGAFTTGIGFAWSTVVGVFTDSATASDHTIAVHYK